MELATVTIQTTRRDIIRYAPADLVVRPRQVARYFGGARYAPDPQTLKRIAAAIAEGTGLILPAVAMGLRRIEETVPGGDIVLAGGLALVDGAELCGPDNVYLAAMVGTLAPQLESHCRELSRRGDIYEATLLDAVGVALLDELGKKIHHELTRRSADEGFFCGCRLGPGLNGFPAEAQRLIFELVDAAAIGVTLNDSLVMTPVKSISFLTPLGPSPGRPSGAKCSQCGLKNCQFRQ